MVTGDMVGWYLAELDRDDCALRGIDQGTPQSVWWKPGDTRGSDCLSVEVNGAKPYRRVWAIGGSEETLEWGRVVADTAVELFSYAQVAERLATIAAHRRIVEQYRSAALAVAQGSASSWTRTQDEAALSVLEAAVRVLVSVMADRPGYQEEWRP